MQMLLHSEDFDMANRAKIRKKYMQDKIMLTCLLHRDLDADIISWLGKQENRSEAIRRALRESIIYQEAKP